VGVGEDPGVGVSLGTGVWVGEGVPEGGLVALAGRVAVAGAVGRKVRVAAMLVARSKEEGTWAGRLQPASPSAHNRRSRREFVTERS
jgi:hypothetical protein